MKKTFTRVGLVVLAVLIVGIVVLAFSLGTIVKNRVEVVGSNLAKVEVKLGAASIWIVPGRAQLTGLAVGNPTGYKTEHAVTVGDVSIRMNPLTALSSKMVIDSIAVKSPEITIEGGLRHNNLMDIRQNLSAGAPAVSEPAQPGTAAASTNAPKRYQINDLVISGAKLHITSLLGTGQNINLSLPDIHLENLGAGDAGITAPDVAEKALTALLESISKNAGDAVAKAGEDALVNGKKFDFKKAGARLKSLFGQ
jgi:uncharacterized protein involved in outer membrane biogenesis